MDIRNTKQLKAFAGERLANSREATRIAMIFAATVVGLSALTSLINYVLGLRIDQSGGLSNMGTRSVLSALQTMLPLVQSVVVMCMELGFVAAMLRVARGQYTSPNTLRLGFDRFWVLLRYTLIQSLIYLGLGFGSMYLGITLFLMTPLSGPTMELLMAVSANASLLNPSIEIGAELYGQLVSTLAPAFVLWGLIYMIVAVPLMYRLRLASYIIIDKPALGALAALRESRKIMRGNCLRMFQLDVSLWWFFLAQVAASVVCYGDQILPALGITLPFSAEFAFFLFYGLYWIAEFLIIVYLRPRADVVYGLAYDAIRPKEENTGGVVLGNIFQM